MNLPLPASVNPLPDVAGQPELVLIYAGGTFGCIGTPLSPMPATEFLPKLDHLIQQAFSIHCHSLPAPHIHDSSQLQAGDWIALVAQIIQLHQQGFRRFLLLHGTDTLAYSSAFLAEVLAHWPLHLVIIGSQYPLLDVHGVALREGSDALDNLSLAIQLLQQDKQGCEVAFAGQHWPAHNVQKIHSSALQAFAGTADNSVTQPDSTDTPAPEKLLHSLNYLKQLNIAIWYTLPMERQQQAQQLQQLISTPQLDAIILLGFGSGNLPHSKDIEQLLQQASVRSILVVISTQVPFGGVNSHYAAGHWLEELNVLSAGQLTVAAIYARLAWICCQTSDFQQRRRYWLQSR
jgi:L-asparaginase